MGIIENHKSGTDWKSGSRTLNQGRPKNALNLHVHVRFCLEMSLVFASRNLRRVGETTNEGMCHSNATAFYDRGGAAVVILSQNVSFRQI